MLIIGLAQFSYAEPGAVSIQGAYPYIDPIREWYDNRQAEFGANYPLAPVYYNSFSVNMPDWANCGWVQIAGQVPYSGLVTVHVYQGLDLVATQNINSDPDQLLRGYIFMPCSTEAITYNVVINWLETPFKISGLNTISYMVDQVTLKILITNSVH